MDEDRIKHEPDAGTSGDEGQAKLRLPGTRSSPFSKDQLDKIDAIRSACRKHDRPAVVEHALSTGGLVSDEVRGEAWPLLLGYEPSEGVKAEPLSSESPQTELPAHADEGQVKLDVNRAFIYYPTNMSQRELNERKKELLDVIVQVLRKHPMLHYFQGFHDICQVIMLVLGYRQAVEAVEHIALLRIRDFMLPSMQPAIVHLRLLFPLLQAADPKLYAHLSETQPFFALAATLTLYAHDVQEYSDIARLFDVFLAMDPVFPLYLFVEIVIQRREELFDIPDDEPEMLHSILSKLPKPLDLEGWIQHAIELLKSHPPEKLSFWRMVPRTSVLKTSGRSLTGVPPGDGISLRQAEELFNQQCQELARAQRRKEISEALMRHKSKAFVGISVIIGISSIFLAVYARKNGWSDPAGTGVFYYISRLFASTRA